MASGRNEQGFDAATRGVAFVRHAPYACLRAGGRDALDLLHRLSTNDLQRVRTGHVVRTILTTEKGRMMFVSRGNEHHFQRWIEKYTIAEDITLTNLGRDAELACLVGPGSLESAAHLAGRSIPADGIAVVQDGSARMTFVSASARWGWEVYLLVASGSGDGGHHLEVMVRDAGIAVIGKDDFEAARIARARPAFGAEISEAFTPHDAGLSEFISTTKGCYIGQEVLARMVTYQKARKGLIGFMSALPLPEAGGKALLFRDDVEVGVLTSSSPKQVYGRSLGLGIVRTDLVSLGDSVAVGEPDADLTCRVVPLPIELPPA